VKTAIPLVIVLALAATVWLVAATLRPTRVDAPPEGREAGTAEEPAGLDRQKPARIEPTRELRRYETTATLAEDLRDALAGDREQLAPEVWRVSRSLQGRPRWTLLNLAAEEASPKVRALLVLTAGRHIGDDDALLDFLTDDWPIVRRAAVLAAGYDARGTRKVELLDGLKVPVGRKLPAATAALLRRHVESERNEAVRTAIDLVNR
jgi:hypothetical protein